MKIIKLVIIFLLIPVAFAIAKSETPICEDHINHLVVEGEDALALTDSFREIIENYKVEPTSGDPCLGDIGELLKLCKNIGTINVDRKPLPWKGGSRAELIGVAQSDCLSTMNRIRCGR